MYMVREIRVIKRTIMRIVHPPENYEYLQMFFIKEVKVFA